MAVPRIPSDMCPLVNGYQIGAAGGVMRTPVGGGRPRYALDWDRGVQQFQVTLLLDQTQFMAWSIFYHRTIKKGAISFEMDIDSGLGAEPHVVNIVPDSYSVVPTGGIFRSVSFIVEAESRVYDLTDEEAQGIVDLYEEYGSAGLWRLLSRLEQFANVDTTEAFGY